MLLKKETTKQTHMSDVDFRCSVFALCFIHRKQNGASEKVLAIATD